MKEKFKIYGFILLIAVIVSIPLFSNRYNIYIDDGIQHICRLIGTLSSIQEGQIFPVIMSHFCNNFGYSWNLFYSPITAYVPLIFHFITNSFVNDMKIFMLLISFLTGMTMYNCVYTITKNKYAGLIGAVIYICAPYRLTDMYIRVAIAELTSFIFIPLVFQGLYQIFNKQEKKPEIYLIIGSTGLVLSHTVIAMLTAIFAFIYVIINAKKLKDKDIIVKIVISLLFIIGITCFFTIPLIEQKMTTDYEVFKPGRMEREEVLIYYKLNPIDLLYTSNGRMVFDIGIVTIIGLVLTPFAIKVVDKKYKTIYLFSLIAGVVSVIMTLKIFPFEKLPSILKMLQFSFRMLEFSSFFFAIVVAINLKNVIKNFKFKDILILTVIIILLLIPMMINNIPYTTKMVDEKSLIPAVKVTANTGRVHAGCASFEYLPTKAFEHMDYIISREDTAIVIEENANIENEEKQGTNLKFTLKDANEGAKIELPYIYYAGYSVKINGVDKTLNIQESENGFVQIELDKSLENAEVIVSYDGTIAMKISAIISFVSIIAFIIYAMLLRKKSN